MNTSPEDKPPQKRRQIDSGWLATCIAIGVAIGAATDNLGIFLALGVALGAVGPFWTRSGEK